MVQRAAAPPLRPQRRFTALRVIAVLLKVGAALLFLSGVLVSLLSCLGGATAIAQLSSAAGPGRVAPSEAAAVTFAITTALVVLVLSTLQALVLWATGDAILVILAIEENTRAAVNTLAGLPAAVEAGVGRALARGAVPGQ
ncbi:MAG: hypothetical protein K6U89_01550 [Chloroflexi bacterium]|nr:hypothetical protein [Chloroflexota bacterium]GIW10350.1 MAG: hypothetical protein KatS3mg061_1407 [Dehalococcoidia bacterium]